MSRSASAALAAALALMAPASALAQSVGDEQYRDPFAGEEPQQGGGGQDGDSAPAPAPAPAPTTSAPAPSAPASPTTDEPVATTAGTLPRTGAVAIGVAVAGVLLLAAGAGLRRSTRP